MPGVGAEIVDTSMEMPVQAPGLPQVRVKDWVVPAERDWEGKIRFITALASTVLVFVAIKGAKDSLCRSSWGLEVDHKQYPGL